VSPAQGLWILIPDQNSGNEQQQHPPGVRHAGSGRIQALQIHHENAQHQQPNGADKNVFPHLPNSVPAIDSILNSKWNCHAHNKQKRRKNQIHKGHGICLSWGVFHPRRDVVNRSQVVDEDHGQNGQAANNIDGGDASWFGHKFVSQ
jgi:hypothetical protein